MKLFKSASNLVFISVIILLTAALVYSAFIILGKDRTIIKKNNEIRKISATLEESEQVIADKTANEALLQQQLEASRQENDALKQENGQLRTDYENLKAVKVAEAKTAVMDAQTQSSVPAGSRVCYLTFDDGPSHNTLKILGILDRYGIKATFFVTNTANTEYIQDIHRKGHTIGLHTYSHVYSQIYSSTEAYFADLEAISNTVEALTGVKSNIIRFPGGSSNVVSRQYCIGIMSQLSLMTAERGYYYFDWNVDSTDAAGNSRSPQLILNNVLNNTKNKDAICVLMHDTSAKDTTVTALPAMIEGLSAQGFRFEALSAESPIFHHGINN